MNAPQTALGVIAPKIHLNVLSNSAIACYRACPREFKYRYVQKRRPRRSSEALRFGSFFHCGLEAWWAVDLNGRPAGDRLEAALMAMRIRVERRSEDADPFELVKAEELMLGYTARWGAEAYETLAVEKEFDVPLLNPETGAASKTYRVQGKIDVVARKPDGKLTSVEHKTTSSDITVGADYWRKVSAMDPQVTTYHSGARAAGFDLDDCTYDVIRKVDLRPLKATPEDKRKYTQEKSKTCPFCKKKGNIPGPHRVTSEGEPEMFCEDGRVVTERGGELYKGQREHDETPEEFQLRVRAHISENPEKYFARGPIVRLEEDEREHAGDVWQTAWMIRESENANRFPRNPGACERFHTLCVYFDVCSGVASINDDTRFRTADRPHEELIGEV